MKKFRKFEKVEREKIELLLMKDQKKRHFKIQKLFH